MWVKNILQIIMWRLSFQFVGRLFQVFLIWFVPSSISAPPVVGNENMSVLPIVVQEGMNMIIPSVLPIIGSDYDTGSLFLAFKDLGKVFFWSAAFGVLFALVWSILRYVRKAKGPRHLYRTQTLWRFSLFAMALVPTAFYVLLVLDQIARNLIEEPTAIGTIVMIFLRWTICLALYLVMANVASLCLMPRPNHSIVFVPNVISKIVMRRLA